MYCEPLARTKKSRMLRCQRNTTQRPPISNLEISHLFPFALLCVLHSIWQSNRQDLQACCQCIASHWLVQKSPVCCVANATPPSVRPFSHYVSAFSFIVINIHPSRPQLSLIKKAARLNSSALSFIVFYIRLPRPQLSLIKKAARLNSSALSFIVFYINLSFLILYPPIPLPYLCLKNNLKLIYYGNNNHYRRIHQSHGRRTAI